MIELPKRWLVMDMGCVECYAPSDVVGVYSSEIEADRIAAALNKSLSKNRADGGHHEFEVFDLWAPQDPLYSKVIRRNFK